MDIQALPFWTGSKVLCIVIFSIAIFKVVFCTEPYQEESLVQHNKYRKRYSAPPLVLSDQLNDAAVKCVNYYSDKDKIDHNCPYREVANFTGDTGENLYMFGGGGGNPSKIGGHAGWVWWKENWKYNYSNIKNVKFDHFTQQIWKRTTHMGIGVKMREGTDHWYVCALYYPPGNVPGGQYSNLSPLDESVKE